jgi:hypothetical protein
MRTRLLCLLAGTCGFLAWIGCGHSGAQLLDASVGQTDTNTDAPVASGGNPGSGGQGRGGAGGAAGDGGDSGGTGGATSIAPDGGSGSGGSATGGRMTGGSTTSTTGGAGASIAGGSGGRGGIDGGGTGGSAVDGGGSGGSSGIGGGCVASRITPAVARGGQYFGFAEKFNRYYADCNWSPSTVVYVSPTGTGDGRARTTPTSAASALAAAAADQEIVFFAGTYSGCFELSSEQSGTYDNPIVLVGEKQADGSPAVTINCCSTGRKTCFNLEAADYVAVDGFELVGGDYGVRAVGADYAADQHQKGVAILNNVGHGQNKDPFFTGQSDWLAIEHCTGYDSGTGDGHGIYLSNGSDWNIARGNETYNTASADFQINADPLSTCADIGIAYTDPECDAVAGSHPTGGRGASDFMLIEGNFFHHSQAQGPNFTSVRNSTIKNNIFALPARHVASFWQETDNPKLGASNNVVAHNLFVTQTANRQAVQFINSSTGNQFKNNVVVAVSIGGGTVSANAGAPLLDTDSTTVSANTFAHNAWLSGGFTSEDGAAAYAPNANELRLTSFDPAWFVAFPTTVAHDPGGFAPTASAPFLDRGDLLPEVPTDRDGTPRHAPVDLGPFER